MKSTFYIAAANPIVRLDLAGALGAQCPQARIVAQGGLEDAAALENLDQVCVFVESDLVDDAALLILSQTDERGAQIVVVGKNVGASFVAATLELPFTNETIAEAVFSAASAQLSRQLEART